MSWKVELPCPRCGAPVTLEETNRLLTCPFCRVSHYLYTAGLPKYYIEPRGPATDKTIFAPYYRYKGMFFFCAGNKIDQRVVDVSLPAVNLPFLPGSLGLRTQTQKIKFISAEMPGRFLSPHLSPEQAVKIIEDRQSLLSAPPSEDEPLPHRAFIGDTVSLIYAPFYLKKKTFYDALIDAPLAELSSLDAGARLVSVKKHDWSPEFIPTVCPDCGWDLDGTRGGLVLACGNCRQVWGTAGGRLVRQPHKVLGGDADTEAFLPFWRVRAHITGLELDTYADLVKAANLPKAVKDEWRGKKFYFWIPAFKIQPQTFLRLSRLVTVAQPDESEHSGALGKTQMYPASLPLSEALESLKVNLANLTVAKKKLIALLPDMEIKAVESTLFFLPFSSNGRELIWPGTQIAINKNILDFGHEI